MDTMRPEQRSKTMRRIRSKNTKPELIVRRICQALGFSGYRIHYKTLPGRPDIAWIGKKTAVFVNGCFWHGHNCRKCKRKPEANREYWIRKIDQNRARDAKHIRALRTMGWSVALIWECELVNKLAVSRKICSLLSDRTDREATV
jgi:DNA mismatch endonuclease (patch repair protein)